MHALVAGVLGHERCCAAGGDLGGGVIQDLGLRFAGFVERQVLFNSVLPLLGEAYEAAGIPLAPPRELRMAADYFVRQGREADALAAELDTPERRRRYVGEFYGHRFWATPGAFSREQVDFMTEPFADAQRLRAGGATTRARSARARFGAAALLRGQRRADARALRSRRPRHLEAVPADVRSRLH